MTTKKTKNRNKKRKHSTMQIVIELKINITQLINESKYVRY